MTDEPPLNTTDGYTISVYFPPGSDPEGVSDFLSRVAADAEQLPHDTDDAFVVGHAGDVLGIDRDCGGVLRLPDDVMPLLRQYVGDEGVAGPATQASEP